MAQMDFLRIIQLVVAVLGLVFTILASPGPLMMLIIFTICMVYDIIIIITAVSGRTLMGSQAHAIIEIILAIVLLVFTIYTTACCSSGNIMVIMYIVCGFILPALFLITAYDGF